MYIDKDIPLMSIWEGIYYDPLEGGRTLQSNIPQEETSPTEAVVGHLVFC